MNESTARGATDRTPDVAPAGRRGRFGLTALALAACLAVAGCAQDDRNDVGQRWLDALNSHDSEQALRLLDADAELRDPTLMQPLRPVAVRDWLDRSNALWRDRVYTAKRKLSQGDVVAIEWQLQQTHPSGKAVPIDGVTLIEVRDGRIRRVRNYYNAGVYLQFLKKRG
ncbi:nuclear transport factor 2 family protein [Candidatus Binatia bacterium]|nr:nuclear transport factor 2 family protein [Candidatus Binatia bacterium]